MLPATPTVDPRSLTLTPHETVTVRRRSPELLEALVHYRPAAKLPVAHRHPAQDERFEVLEGTLRVVVEGTEHLLTPGETLSIPRGTVHAMGAHGDRDVRATWQTRPALETERWWTALAAAHEQHEGAPPLPVLARLLRRHRAEFELALPTAVAGPLLWLASRLPLPRRRATAPAPPTDA